MENKTMSKKNVTSILHHLELSGVSQWHHEKSSSALSISPVAASICVIRVYMTLYFIIYVKRKSKTWNNLIIWCVVCCVGDEHRHHSDGMAACRKDLRVFSGTKCSSQYNNGLSLIHAIILFIPCRNKTHVRCQLFHDVIHYHH